jgi:outer membrane protein OmpA-like peptidoglycan-associated protein
MDHRLTVQNRIVLDDFALGRRVAARNALDLPLDLAVALHTDENGRISVAIPIEGDVDSPRFDYGRLLREALANLVTRVVSAPFRFLGMLAGNGRDDLGTVHFEPGSARLEPPEHKTLAGVAQVLAERPQLKLVVRGPYDPRRDGEALRTDRARRALAVELGLAPRRDPGPVAYGEAATQRALERLLTALGGSGAVERVAVAHASRLGREPQRVSGFADAFGRASPDREFYEAVFLRLAELEALDESALQGLAARRAEAIVAHLVKTGVDAGRTELGAVRAVDAGDEPAVEASLGVELMRSGREDSVRQVGLLAD